ncbi:MAG TPA: secretin and TonB N-terminal domain-containing protein [Methylophilaceae bacterium]|nr:secretin and TonB N-terminal domain-containing protein [Methylophilaceae bacterium]
MAVVLAGLASCTTLPWENPPPKTGPPGSTIPQTAPETPDRMAYLKERASQMQELLESAERASLGGDLDEAERLLNEVLAIDAQNQRAFTELDRIANFRRHPGMVEEAGMLLEKGDEFAAEKRVRQVLMENPKNRDALQIYTAILKKREDKKALVPVLKTTSSKPISLEFREANLKMVFEALSRTTGINFILDKDIRNDQKTTVFIKSAPLQDVLDSLLSANQLQKKVINEDTVVIYPNTPLKAREYQELVMRTFYLANADVKQTAVLLKTMLQVKDIFTDEKINLVVIRDTPDVIRMAEQLVLAQDIADPEVVLDVEILEINRNKATELGIKYPNQLSVLSGDEAVLTMNRLKNLSSSDIGVTPNPALNFKDNNGAANLLANPSIRVRNREKARIHIGDRIPVITSNVASTGTISESVQYLDVGLKLEVEPSVNIEDDVSIRIGLDVGTLGPSFTTVNGSRVFQIGTRNASTLLRLHDGETQILAGLINDQDRSDISKLPGLGDIPLLGRLFSNKSSERTKTDVILSITPHVIRNLPVQTAASAEVVIGTESSLGRVPTSVRGGVLPAMLMPLLNRAPAATPAQPASSSDNTAPAASGKEKESNDNNNGVGLPKSLTYPLGQ